MPKQEIRSNPDHLTTYYLVVFNKYGGEVKEKDGTLLSKTVLRLIESASPPYTDIFFCSHGWKGDIPGAIAWYDEWIGAMVSDKVKADVEAAHERIKGFKPLIVALHWPSQPWGDEKMPVKKSTEMALRKARKTEPTSQAQIDDCADDIADTKDAKEAISVLLDAAQNSTSEKPSQEVQDALEKLATEAGLGSDSMPPEERVPFEFISDPHPPSESTLHTLGLPNIFASAANLVVTGLRQLSFWTMKARARTVGESGGHLLLQSMQTEAEKAARKAGVKTARIHLMGHSFGCIVVSAVIGGSDRNKLKPIPVTTLFLVQGALSIWAFSPRIPFPPGTPGHFYPLIRDGLVKGSYVTTLSSKDTAVGDWYPWAAWFARQVVLGPLPKYGAIGSFGIQGVPNITQSNPLVMKPVNDPYDFAPQRIYNLDASDVIKNGAPPSGAHNDIAHPEVAHAFWAAVLAGQGRPNSAPHGPTKPDDKGLWVNVVIPSAQSSTEGRWPSMTVSIDRERNPASAASLRLSAATLASDDGSVRLVIGFESKAVEFNPTGRTFQVSGIGSHPQSFNFKAGSSGGKAILKVFRDGDPVEETDFAL